MFSPLYVSCSRVTPFSNFSIGMFDATFNQSGLAVIPNIFAASEAYLRFALAAALVKALLFTFSAHSSAATTLFISYLPGPFLSTRLAQKSAVAESIGHPLSRNHTLS